MAEDCADLVRAVVERIPWPRPVRPGVLEAAAIRVDEAAHKLLRPPFDEVELPVGQRNLPLVLLAGPVLRE